MIKINSNSKMDEIRDDDEIKEPDPDAIEELVDDAHDLEVPMSHLDEEGNELDEDDDDEEEEEESFDDEYNT